MRARTSAIVTLAVMLAATSVAAQQRLLTLDDLYDPEKKVDFSGSPPTGLAWLKDGTHYLQTRTDEKTRLSEHLKVDTLTGKSEPFFDAAKMEAALVKLPGITAEDARQLAHRRTYTMNDARTALVLNHAGDLYYYELGSDRATRLTYSPAEETNESFSPDGKQVAFVRNSNLFVVDVAHRREHALTTDGSDDLLNGRLDWVYQEEVYGRGDFKGYWWSPDSTKMAFLRLDEKPVPKFTVVDHLPYHLGIETTEYPKAGDPNPGVALGVLSAAGGSPRWIDTSRYLDFLIVRVAWSPDSKQVVYQAQNREQTWLDLNVADGSTEQSRTLFRETGKAWVNHHRDPYWLKDGSFLWLSERDGFEHLYHYGADGKLLRQITSGKWEVRALHGVDEARGWVYFSGTEHTPIGSNAYRVKLDGSGLTRLTQSEGTHQVLVNPSFTHFLDTWSDVNTPPQVRLYGADGALARLVDENPVRALAEYRLGKAEFLQVKTRDGFTMEAFLLKPPDFDPGRKYPVMSYTYSGPHSQSVRNAWGGATNMWYHLLAERGFLVWICDNRTASGKGIESTWPVYEHFGELELRDLEDGLAWLKQQPYVDDSRIGLWGWSYGGFMTSYALTHSTSFKVGIAGGTVADWRDYDTIYTERYMNTPQNNPDGYRNSSPVHAAKDLHGKLLLIHGTMDDNVHMQNTIQFVYELQKAGKPFQLMLYPKSRHGVTDPALLKHLRMVMTTFILENLGDGQMVPRTANPAP